MTQPVVNVDTLPGDDVYPDLVDSNAAGLRKAGSAVAARGTRVNAHWKKLGAHYGAPETHTLVAKLGPAEKTAASFGHRMGLAATALTTFAEDARGIKKRAEAIRARARTFLDGVVAHGVTKQTYIPSSASGGYTKVDHERWDQDSAAVAENDAIIAEIEQLANDLEAAEARCANAITGAVGADPVTGPGTSVDWTAVPAGTPTPWGTVMGRRNENNDEAVGRGMLTGLIGLETSLMALQGWQNKTMTYENVKNGSFDPWALDHSFALQGRSLLGVGQFALGLVQMAVPVTALVTMTNLGSKGPLGDYSRATTGVTIDGAKAFLAWDKWKDDPNAAYGETLVNLGTLLIPGAGEAAPAEIAARVGVRASEEAVAAGGRVAVDAGAGTARTATEAGTRAGTEVGADAVRGGLRGLSGAATDASAALGHAEPRVPTTAGSGYRPGGLSRATEDFGLDHAPTTTEAPAPRAPSHVDVGEPARPATASDHPARGHDDPVRGHDNHTHDLGEHTDHAARPEHPDQADHVDPVPGPIVEDGAVAGADPVTKSAHDLGGSGTKDDPKHYSYRSPAEGLRDAPAPSADRMDALGSHRRYTPGSEDHMYARWKKYQTTAGTDGWSWEQWRNTYVANQANDYKGAAFEDVVVHDKSLDADHGWTEQHRQHDPVDRQYDFANPKLDESWEIKSSDSVDKVQLAKDSVMTKLGHRVHYVFGKPPTPSSVRLMREAGVTWEVIHSVGHPVG